jgi:hypothetical protein
MPAVQAQGQPVPTAITTQVQVLQLAPVIAGNAAVASVITTLQQGVSQLLINPVPSVPAASVTYQPSPATVAAIIADLQILQAATLQQLSATYGITS